MCSASHRPHHHDTIPYVESAGIAARYTDAQVSQKLYVGFSRLQGDSAVSSHLLAYIGNDSFSIFYPCVFQCSVGACARYGDDVSTLRERDEGSGVMMEDGGAERERQGCEGRGII